MARILVEKHLVACVNIHENVLSVYRWDGEIQQAPEVVIIAKTRRELVAVVIDTVKNLHSYQLPCIIASPIVEGFGSFLQWVADETTCAKSGTAS
jgi:periplasmic divalent cation tolerance protein